MNSAAIGTAATAKRLGCSLGWVYVLIRTGELPATRGNNGEWLVPVAAINERRKRRKARLEARTKPGRGLRIPPREAGEELVPTVPAE
jgi:hypothetical protein